jgi:D-methionine transport system ATP-binding protein
MLSTQQFSASGILLGRLALAVHTGAFKLSSISDPAEIPVMRLQAVEKTYRSASGGVHALRQVDLAIRKGEVLGIIGRSGAGKSTLLRILNLLEQPSSGSVLFAGQDITQASDRELRQLRQKIGVVFQQFNLLRSRTVYENVRLPLRVAGNVSPADQRTRIQEVLDLVGLAGYTDRYPAQLSGGQQQRVGIARALVNNPSVLLCDEATSALDTETTHSILALLRDINQRLNLTIVLIAHSMDVIRSTADRVAVIDSGRIVEAAPVVDVFLKPQHATTRALLAEATPDADIPLDSVWQQQTPGRVLRLTYRGALVATPLLTDLAQELNQHYTILQGSVGRIGEMPYADLIVGTHDDSATQRLLDALVKRGVDYEVLR